MTILLVLVLLALAGPALALLVPKLWRRQDPVTERPTRSRGLFRASDPIGGPVRHRYLADEGLYDVVIAALTKGQPPGADRNDVDRQFLDPLFDRVDGNMVYPQTLGHSGYFEDPYFPGCVAKVIELARLRRTDPPHARPT